MSKFILKIADGNLLEIRKHHNQGKYPNQEIMYVRVLKEVYAVPYRGLVEEVPKVSV